MRRMRGKGASLSFDPNLRPSLWPSERRMIAEINALAAHAHWVLPGLEAACSAAGRNPRISPRSTWTWASTRWRSKLGPERRLLSRCPRRRAGPRRAGGDRGGHRGRRRRLRGRGGQRAAGRPAAAATRWRAATGSAAARYRSAATWRGCRNAANCSTASAAGAPEPAAHAAPVATRTRQAQEIPDHDHVRLASSRWWYIMPIVFVTYSLAYLDRANYGFAAASGMADDLRITRAVLAAGRAVLPRLLLLPGAGGDLRGKRSVKKLIFVSLILWGGLPR